MNSCRANNIVVVVVSAAVAHYSFTIERLVRTLLILLPLLLLLCASSVRAADVPRQDLLSHGTDEMYWIAQVRTPAASSTSSAPAAGSEYTSIRRRQVAGDGRWSEIGRVPARVTSIANRGAELAVLLESREWMILWPGGSSMGAAPPDRARLLTLGSGPTSLWAIAVGARTAPATSKSTATTSKADDTSTERVSTGASEETYAAPGLYKLDRGTWLRQATLPRDIDVRSPDTLSLTVVAGNPVLASLQAGGDIRVLRWNDDEDQWEDLGRVRAAAAGIGDIAQFKVLASGQSPVLWVAPQQGAGQLRFARNDWADARPLVIGADHTAAAPVRAITVAANVRLVFADPGKPDQLFEQTFNGDGQPVQGVTALPQLASQIEPLPMRWLTGAAAAMLMIVVIASVRRGPPPEGVSGITPAPLSLRFMAGMIDAIPLAAAMVLLSRDVASPNPTVDELMAAVGYPFYISLGVYLLHTWLSEHLFDRTLGKYMFRLRVVTLENQRPSRGAIFTRNILRLVDVMIVVPLLLVIFSPLKQRVGDIAARTVVVMDEKAKKPTAEE